jgi:hypothetical protein
MLIGSNPAATAMRGQIPAESAPGIHRGDRSGDLAARHVAQPGSNLADSDAGIAPMALGVHACEIGNELLVPIGLHVQDQGALSLLL